MYGRACLPLFSDMRAPASLKVAKLARVVKRSAYPVNESVTAKFNFNIGLPPAPPAAVVAVGSEWDNAIWDVSIWDTERSEVITGAWKSVGGSGHDVSAVVMVTSGLAVPIDVEVVRIDMTYSAGDIVT